MYVYEGHDYRETSSKDQEAFDNMMAGNFDILLTAILDLNDKFVAFPYL